VGRTTILNSPPHGLLRFGLRMPIWLYRLHLGWLFGHRFLLLTHKGRNSGKLHQTVIEVVKYEQATNSFYVVSGWGANADWYQNIHANSPVHISSGRQNLQAQFEDISLGQSIEILSEYAGRFPVAFRELTALFLRERLLPGPDVIQRLAEMMPMICFSPYNPRNQ